MTFLFPLMAKHPPGVLECRPNAWYAAVSWLAKPLDVVVIAVDFVSEDNFVLGPSSI